MKEVLNLQRLEKEIKKLSVYVNNCKEDIEDTSDNQSEARFDSPHRLSRAIEREGSTNRLSVPRSETKSRERR